nr:replication protein A 32 kDa subunit B [Tanacetum cinerariifolium]
MLHKKFKHLRRGSLKVEQLCVFPWLLIRDFLVLNNIVVMKVYIHLQAVDDSDEITHHFVECIYGYNTKLMKADGSNKAHMPTSTTYKTVPTNQI